MGNPLKLKSCGLSLPVSTVNEIIINLGFVSSFTLTVVMCWFMFKLPVIVTISFTINHLSLFNTSSLKHGLFVVAYSISLSN